MVFHIYVNVYCGNNHVLIHWAVLPEPQEMELEAVTPQSGRKAKKSECRGGDGDGDGDEDRWRIRRMMGMEWVVSWCFF